MALVLSVLIHVLILLLYRPLGRIRIFPEETGEVHAAPPEPLVFELVETPDDAMRRRPDAANLLSDKNAVARDEYEGRDKPVGEAYSEGEVPYRIFSGQTGPAGGSQTQVEEEQEQLTPDEIRDFAERINQIESSELLEFQQVQDLSEEVNKGLYLKLGRDKSAPSRNYSDDIDFDQREYSAEDLGGVSLNTYEWDFAFYILEMKRKLKSNTFPPAAFTHFGMISGETVLKFKVLPDGTATDITVIEYTGDKTLMETSVDAVENSSPFRSLPRDFPEEYLELTWTFIYFTNRR
jgi:hypothetical protein